MKRFTLFLALLTPFAVQAKAPSAYRAVMQAQYAAKTPMPPLSAAEAKHIYQAYLQSIGKPHHRQITPSHDSNPVAR